MNSQQMTISEALQKAIEAHKASKLQDAERIYRVILQVQPNHPDANHNLGVLAVQVGKPEAGLPHFKLALEACPRCDQFWLSYVDALVKNKNIDNAQLVLNRARSSGLTDSLINNLEVIIASNNETLCLQPGQEVELNKASDYKDKKTSTNKKKAIDFIVQQFSCRNYTKAEEMSKDFIRQYPKDGFGYKVLGSILTQCKKSEEAIRVLEKGLSYSNNDHIIYNSLAAALNGLGRFDEAVLNYKKAVEIKPDYAEAYYNMGNVFQELGKFDEAVLNYKKAVEIKPDYSEAYNNMGNALSALGRLDDAVLNYKKAVEVKFNNSQAYYNMGNALRELGNFDEAILNYKKAVEIKSDFAEAYNNMGSVFKELGKFDEAILNYKKALKVKPDFAEAYYNASDVRNFHFEDSALSELNKIVISKKYLPQEQMLAHFALGNFYNINKNYSDAFRSFSRGHKFRSNINKSQGHQYRHDLLLERLDFFKKIFTQQFFINYNNHGLSVDTPIFIIGFPRSGTSLVEQILASHSSVYGAGELKDIAKLRSSFVDFKKITTYAQFLMLISKRKILELSNKYLEKIKLISNNSRYVTDKMPHNFEHLWFINLLFKNITILHCTRRSEDTCLSCYLNKFTEGHEYIDNLQDLASHYKYYLQMMDLWKSVLPTRIYDVSYEKLVSTPESEIRNLLSVCNLDFEKQCLEFYKTKRPVKTASTSQVREKMYTSSVGKWKRYEQFLGPLLDELHKD